MATVAEIMTREVVTLDPDTSLRDALEVFRGSDVSGAPVVQGEDVVGVVSATDILEFQATNPGVPSLRPEESEWGEFEAPETWEEGSDSPSAFFVDFWSDAAADLTARFEESASPEWDLLEGQFVGEVMNRTVVSLPPDATIVEAARLMTNADVQRVLVVEDHSLRGILTTTDIVRAVAGGKV